MYAEKVRYKFQICYGHATVCRYTLSQDEGVPKLCMCLDISYSYATCMLCISERTLHVHVRHKLDDRCHKLLIKSKTLVIC